MSPLPAQSGDKSATTRWRFVPIFSDLVFIFKALALSPFLIKSANATISFDYNFRRVHVSRIFFSFFCIGAAQFITIFHSIAMKNNLAL
jgi:hypothetical protein